MSSFYFDNAIAWAQFRIKGGWKNLLTLAVGDAALIALGVTLAYQTARTPSERRDAMEIASLMVLVSQIILLLTLGSMAVGGAIRNDLTNRQIESHRLMPLAPLQAVVGYISGATCRTLALFAVNLIAGVCIRLSQGMAVQNWVMANLLVLVFALMLWCVMALASFISRWLFWIIVGVFSMMVFSQGELFTLAPGLLVLCATVQRGFASAVRGPSLDLNNHLVVSLAAQALLAALFILGAARKYRRGDVPGMPIWFSITLLLIWIGVSIYGIDNLASLRSSMFGFHSENPKVSFIGTIAASLIVAMPLMSSVACLDIAREQHRRAAGLPRSANPWLFLSCLAICVVLITCITAANAPPRRIPQWFLPQPGQPGLRMPVVNQVVELTRPWAPTAMLSAIFLSQIYLLMRMMYTAARRPNLGITAAVAMLWFLPLAADGIYYSLVTPDKPGKIDHFGLISPLGFIINSYDPQANLLPGLAAQFGILAALFILHRWLQKRRYAKNLLQSTDLAPLPTVQMQISADA